MKLYKEWCIITSENDVLVLKVSKVPLPSIVISFTVFSDKSVKIYTEKELGPAELNVSFNLNKEKTEIDTLFKCCDSFVPKGEKNKLSTAVKLLEKHEMSEVENQFRLSIIIEQLELLSLRKERYRYRFSSGLLQLALKMFLISPACYWAVRKSKLLIQQSEKIGIEVKCLRQ